MEIASAWKTIFGSILSNTYKEKLRKIIEYIDEKNKVLSRDINDLEDVRIAMRCLREIQNDFISLDMEIIAIVETYDLMTKYNIGFSQEEQNTIDNLPSFFSSLLSTVILCTFYKFLKYILTFFNVIFIFI